MAKKDDKSKKAEQTDSMPLIAHKPMLRINEDDLPVIKDWNVDGEYTLKVKVKLTELGRSDYEEKPKLHGSFKILDVSTSDKGDFEKGMDSSGYASEDKEPKR